MSATTLDLKGLNCPLPVIRAMKAYREMMPGDEIEILATDPQAGADFDAFCQSTGARMLDSRSEGGVYILRIRKPEDAP